MKRLTILCLCALACTVSNPPEDTGVDAQSPDAPMPDVPQGDTGPSGDTGPDIIAVDSGGPDTIASPDSSLPDVGPDVIIDSGPPVTVESVDLLFVVDNSGSMGQEQDSLAEEIPSLVQALSTGQAPDGMSFPPIGDLRVGVVTTDMGVGGYAIATCAEPNFGDDGIMRRGSDCGVSGASPPFLGFRPGDDAEDFADTVACLTRPGTTGCGFEQQLDAMLKSVTPQESPITFVNGSRGHGNGANDSFVREDSLLVVVVLTDEDDCSAADPELFNAASTTYPEPNLNIRCSRFGAPSIGALHPTSRYVDGLLALHPPERVIYHVVAGIPVDLAPDPGAAVDYDVLIGDESVRDPRMLVQEDPDPMNGGIRPSCDVEGRGRAFPPVRLVGVAQGLERRGAGVVLQSICQERLGLSSALTARIARHL